MPPCPYKKGRGGYRRATHIVRQQSLADYFPPHDSHSQETTTYNSHTAIVWCRFTKFLLSELVGVTVLSTFVSLNFIKEPPHKTTQHKTCQTSGESCRHKSDKSIATDHEFTPAGASPGRDSLPFHAASQSMISSAMTETDNPSVLRRK